MVRRSLIIIKEELANMLQDDQIDTILQAMLNFAYTAEAPGNLVRPCDLGNSVSKQEQGRRLTVLRKRNLVRKIKVGEYMFDPSVAIVVTEDMSNDDFNGLVEDLEKRWVSLEK